MTTFNDHPFLGGQIDTGPRDQGRYLGFVMTTREPIAPDTLYALVPGGELPEQSLLAMSVSIEKFTNTSGVCCSNLDMVEALAIEHMVANSAVMTGSNNVHEIRRAQTSIALETKRGCGNAMLMHPATAYEFKHSLMTHPSYHHVVGQTTHQEFKEQHGWSLFNTGHPSVLPETWIKPTMPRGIGLVVYKGTPSDCGYLAIGHWRRPYFVVNDFGRPPGHAYARVVKF